MNLFIPSKPFIICQVLDWWVIQALASLSSQLSSSSLVSFIQDELITNNVLFSAQNIPGVPGEDYPIFVTPPETQFACGDQIEGYYADTDADCQAFHICAPDGSNSLIKYSFLCPNGTLFNQQYFICDWWFNVDCSQVRQTWSLSWSETFLFQAPNFYSLNADIAAAAAAANDNRDGRNLDLAGITDLKNLGDINGSGRRSNRNGRGGN